MTPTVFLNELTALYSEETLLTEDSQCWNYGYDNSRRHAPPCAVVFPSTHEQVEATIKLCNQHSISMTTRGKATGTTGACVPLHHALVMSTERLNNIVNIDPDNRAMTVQPGVTNQQVQEAAKQHGFFWPPDPTSSAVCTVGGNLAYNSAGPRAVKYGTPRENTLALKCVTGDGKTLTTGAYTTKSVVGFDLTRLIIGSEGSLAVITEATLKLTPLPQSKVTFQATYKTLNAATKAIANIMANPITPCALEFMDQRAIQLVEKYAGLSLGNDAQALLMIELDGDTAHLQQQAEQVMRFATNDGLFAIEMADTEERVAQLWKARKALSPSLRKVAPKKINEDVVVPVSRIPDLIAGLEDISKTHDIPIVNFGHAGNGNIHVNLLTDPDHLEKAQACLADVFDLVITLKGSLSGEHGIGLEKRDFVDRELSPVAIDLMKKIKAQFDPNNLLNPDKQFPLGD